MGKQAGRLYEFGPFRLDVSERRLLCREEAVPVAPKLFETLLVLVEHAGHVLTKDELMRALWPDSFVEESSLMQNISLLRKALGAAGSEQFIETVPKHGYRFVAPVRVLEAGGDISAEKTEEETPKEAATATSPDEEGGAETSVPYVSASPPKRPARAARRRLLTACAAVLLLSAFVVGAVYFFRGAKTPGPEGAAGDEARVRSLAVLPFKPLAHEGGDEFLGLGVADALIAKLGAFEQINVRPTGAVIKYAARESDPRAAGRELDVDAVVDGTIQHEGERVRVTVVMLGARDGRVLWSGVFDGRDADIFELQDSISERVAHVLRLRLAPGGEARLNKRFTSNAEAYRLYTTGLYFWNKRTKDGLAKAVEYFRAAADADPGYALALAMLANT